MSRWRPSYRHQAAQLQLFEEVFAFADMVEPLPGGVTARLDLLESAGRRMLRETASPLKAAHELPTRLLEFEAKEEELQRLPSFDSLVRDKEPPSRLALQEDRWYRLLLGTPGIIPARRYTSVHSDVADRVSIVDIQRLDAKQEWELARLHQIGQAGEVDGENLKAWIRQAAAAELVATYHVGQGGCNAICDNHGRPKLYFDLGGGTTSNAETYPPGFVICHFGQQPVVLSHWDMDHWATGDRDPACLDHPWVVPDQSVGPTHLKFASRLHAHGNLHVWPAALPRLKAGSLEIVRCTGRSRNNSGLAAIVELVGSGSTAYPVLLPGDARYSKIPLGSHCSFGALVASHHGSKSGGAPPPPHPGRHQLVYLYGAPNSYHHPDAAALAVHSATGWSHSMGTPKGSVALAPPPTAAPINPTCFTPACAPCCGHSCSLSLAQS